MDGSRDLVFQCENCNTILSDGRELVGVQAVQDSQAIVVRGVTGVQVDGLEQEAWLTAGDRATYFGVLCGCGSMVGRVYPEPPATLPAAAGCFVLDGSKCKSYQLGTAEIRQPGAPPGGEPGAPASLAARLEELEAELLKMQGMILVHDSQLQGLAGYQSTLQPGGSDATEGGGWAGA